MIEPIHQAMPTPPRSSLRIAQPIGVGTALLWFRRGSGRVEAAPMSPRLPLLITTSLQKEAQAARSIYTQDRCTGTGDNERYDYK